MEAQFMVSASDSVEKGLELIATFILFGLSIRHVLYIEFHKDFSAYKKINVQESTRNYPNCQLQIIQIVIEIMYYFIPSFEKN